MRALFLGMAVGLAGLSPLGAASQFVIIEGLGGAPEYSERFADEAGRVAAAARRSSGDDANVRLLRGPEARLDNLVKVFSGLQALSPDDSLAVILIGHGTDDGEQYKFNIPGPDITAERLANLLDKIPVKRQLVVNTTSASGGAVDALKGPSRIVVSATKNGRERNATVFSRYWADAFEAPEADQDKNETITVAEAFQFAQAKVAAYFDEAKRLATEHPSIEGELAESFVLARLGASAEALNDPALRPLTAKREKLEIAIDELKLQKDAMSEEDYFNKLQALLIDLAEVQAEITAKTEGQP
ncbi:MAG: hypothetical protein GC160_06330 [Acidobacteria bacterium]|nr:hypothetical protein [Acidobacteriota bacterium]